MRGKNFAYLWATAVFILFSVTDTLFALPDLGEASEPGQNTSQPSCKTESGLPADVSNRRDRSSGSLPMTTGTKVWKNLVCTLSGN